MKEDDKRRLFKRNDLKDIEVFFSDYDKNLTKNYKNDIGLLINNASVEQAISTLIMTPKGSVPFRPDFGCEINNILFENVSYIQADRIRSRVEKAIKENEPRVIIKTVEVSIDDTKPNTYDVYIHYKTIYDNVESYTLHIPISSNR